MAKSWKVNYPEIDEYAKRVGRERAAARRAAERQEGQMSGTSVCRDGAMSIAEAVIFSGLGRSTLYTLMESGDLAYTTVRRRRLVPRRALVELLDRGLVGGK